MEVEIAGLVERFADLQDARVEGRTDHDLLDIAVLAICYVIDYERNTWLRLHMACHSLDVKSP